VFIRSKILKTDANLKTNAVFENTKDMDEAIDHFITTLLKSNPIALSEMKRITWQHTEHWEKELIDNAAISGRLVLSEQTKLMLEKLKKK